MKKGLEDIIEKIDKKREIIKRRIKELGDSIRENQYDNALVNISEINKEINDLSKKLRNVYENIEEGDIFYIDYFEGIIMSIVGDIMSELTSNLKVDTKKIYESARELIESKIYRSQFNRFSFILDGRYNLIISKIMKYIKINIPFSNDPINRYLQFISLDWLAKLNRFIPAFDALYIFYSDEKETEKLRDLFYDMMTWELIHRWAEAYSSLSMIDAWEEVYKSK